MKQYSISKDNIKCVRYDLMSAGINHHIYEHPQTQMKKLGINMLEGIPESIADCWIIITDYQGELPDYIQEIKLKLHDSYWSNWDIDIVE